MSISSTLSYLGSAIALALAAAGGACDGSSPSAAPPDETGGQPASHAPAAPTQLAATGSLHHIALRWAASTGATGYHVYRSAGAGAAPIRLTGAPTAATSYDDPIASPAGDGVLYTYEVTAVGDGESPPSNAARTMHGTRLEATYLRGHTRPELSPYVAEHARTVMVATFSVDPGTALYVLDGAVIDFESSQYPESGYAPPLLDVQGLIRATPSSAAPATFTAHRHDGGALHDGEGFKLVFRGVPYNPADGSGSLLEHVQIDHLDAGISNIRRGGLTIAGGGLRIHDAKLTGATRDGLSWLSVQLGTWVILDDSYLDRIGLSISTDVSTTPFSVTRNVFRHAASVHLDPAGTVVVAPGQIAGNDLDGVAPPSSGIPLGNNYWAGAPGSPPLPSLLSDPSGLYIPGPPLASPPPAGPDW